MRYFKDAAGFVWTIDLNVGAIRRVKGLLDVDLTLPQSTDAVHGTLSQRLVVDVWLLVDVLCALCRPQAEAKQITDELFAERLGGTVLGEARAVLIEEWSDFFLSLGRADLAAAVAKTFAMATAIGAEAVQQMDRLAEVLLLKASEEMAKQGDQALSTAMRSIRNESGA